MLEGTAGDEGRFLSSARRVLGDRLQKSAVKEGVCRLSSAAVHSGLEVQRGVRLTSYWLTIMAVRCKGETPPAAGFLAENSRKKAYMRFAIGLNVVSNVIDYERLTRTRK